LLIAVASSVNVPISEEWIRALGSLEPIRGAIGVATNDSPRCRFFISNLLIFPTQGWVAAVPEAVVCVLISALMTTAG